MRVFLNFLRYSRTADRHSINTLVDICQEIMPPDSLEDLIDEAREGNRDSAQQLLSYCRPLLRLTAKQWMDDRFRGRFDESDVVQLACVSAYQDFPAFRGQSDRELMAWLKTILKRSLAGLMEHHTVQKRDIGRETRQSPSWGSRQGDSELSIVWRVVNQNGPGPVSQVIRGEKAVLLARALQSLPADYHRVIEMRFVQGMKLQEIAIEMQASMGRVAGLLRRAVETLHGSLPEDLRKDLEGTIH